MQLSDNISNFSKPQTPTIFGIHTGNSHISQKKATPKKAIMPDTEKARMNFSYQMPYPGKDSYHFPSGTSHTSPCMDPFWRAQPIREGKPRDDL